MGEKDKDDRSEEKREDRERKLNRPPGYRDRMLRTQEEPDPDRKRRRGKRTRDLSREVLDDDPA